MDADSVSHMMHSEHLITDSDYEAITAAPNDINMNHLLLQYVRAMDMTNLLKFCKVLKNIETQQCIGENLETCMLVMYVCMKLMYVFTYIIHELGCAAGCEF